MIRSFTAFTNEIDDVALALSQLEEALGYEGKLLRFSIGIITCFPEYMQSGVVEALVEKLPFETIGITTIANAVAGEMGETMLTIMVLTSDDVDFVTGVTAPVEGETPELLRSAYAAAVGDRQEKPSFMLSFAPLLFNVSGDFFVENMDEITGGVPNFGTLPVDHNQDYHESCVLLNGSAYRDRYAFLLFYGDVQPQFFLGTISDEKVFQEKGAITASQGNQLQAVNGKSVTEYLISLGLTQNEDGSITGINSFPIIVDYNDGTEPAVRVMFALTPEGYAVCGGRVPVGATFTMGRFDAEEILSTSTNALERALSGKAFSTLLIFSCVGRYFTLQYDQMAELSMILSHLQGKDIEYMAAYAGGEICPAYNKAGVPTNRAHNNTFVICAF